MAVEPIRWRSVWGLAILQGAVSLSWLIYNLYLPRLLGELGFAEGFALQLVALEQGIGALVEPIAGGVSDRLRQWLGSHFLVVAGGVAIAAALFVGVPAVGVLGRAGLRWGAVTWIALWAIAMAAFRAPALALLANYASPPQWPAAMGAVTLVGGLVGALRPVTTPFWLGLGPGVAFAVGSLALVGAMLALRRYQPEPLAGPIAVAFPWRSLPVLGRLALVGAATAWALRLLMGNVVPAIAERYGSDELMPIWLGLAGFLLAVAAWPAGKITAHFGVRGTVAIAAGVSAAGFGLLPMAQGPFLAFPVGLGLLAGVGTVFNGGIPLALQGVTAAWGSLAVGMYFGGFSGAMAVFGWVWPQGPDLATAHLMGAIALAGVGSLTFTVPRWPAQREEG
ncbi:MAG: SLC45 family MFS transporter [Oscillatoriales cyanobacterium SM2_1_8]|nr:SLC45 family MFS transporter [Oscillatoriales cyanobacterium SM2_1_8]